MQSPYLNSSFNEDIIVNKTAISQNSSTKGNHYHNFYEIYFFNGNNMKYFIDNDVYEIEDNNIVLIDKLSLHRTLYSKSSKGERYLVLINPNIFTFFNTVEIKNQIELLFQNKIISFSSGMSLQYTAECFNRLLFNELSPDSHWKRERSFLIITELLLSFLDLPPKSFEYDKDRIKNPKEKHVYNIINYLNDNYQNNVSLDELSSQFYIDKHYLCHIFKETTGVTVTGFLNTKRLSEAERMIRYTTLKITEICRNMGFNSMSYFIKLFKEHYGCSPSEFRKQSQLSEFSAFHANP